MRLDRYIAQSTGLTRAQARKVITCKRVKVAGEVQRKASFSVADCLEVSLDDQPLKLRQHIYLMLNKKRLLGQNKSVFPTLFCTKLSDLLCS